MSQRSDRRAATSDSLGDLSTTEIEAVDARIQKRVKAGERTWIERWHGPLIVVLCVALAFSVIVNSFLLIRISDRADRLADLAGAQGSTLKEQSGQLQEAAQFRSDLVKLLEATTPAEQASALAQLAQSIPRAAAGAAPINNYSPSVVTPTTPTSRTPPTSPPTTSLTTFCVQDLCL